MCRRLRNVFIGCVYASCDEQAALRNRYLLFSVFYSKQSVLRLHKDNRPRIGDWILFGWHPTFTFGLVLYEYFYNLSKNANKWINGIYSNYNQLCINLEHYGHDKIEDSIGQNSSWRTVSKLLILLGMLEFPKLYS